MESPPVVTFGLQEELQIQFGAVQPTLCIPLTPFEYLVLTSTQMLRYTNSTLEDTANIFLSTAVFLPREDAILCVCGITNSFLIFKRLDFSHPACPPFPTHQFGIFHLLFFPDTNAVVSVGDETRIWHLRCRIPPQRWTSDPGDAHFALRAVLPTGGDVSLLNPPCAGASFFILPTASGFAKYGLDGSRISLLSRTAADTRTPACYCPFTDTLLTSEPSGGVCRWGLHGAMEARYVAGPRDVLALRTATADCLLLLDASFRVFLLDCGTRRVFAVAELPARPASLVVFSAAPRRVAMSVAGRATVYGLHVPWRLWVSSVPRAVRLQRTPECLIAHTRTNAAVLISPRTACAVTSVAGTTPWPAVAFDGRRRRMYVCQDRRQVLVFGLGEDGGGCDRLCSVDVYAIAIVFFVYAGAPAIGLVTAGAEVVVCDPERLVCVRRIAVASERCVAAVADECFNTIIAFTERNIVRYDAERERALQKIRFTPGVVHEASGTHVVVGYADGRVVLIEIRAAEIVVVEEDVAHAGAVTGVAFAQEFFVTVAADGVLRAWNYGRVCIGMIILPLPLSGVEILNRRNHIIVGTDEELMLIEGRLIVGGCEDDDSDGDRVVTRAAVETESEFELEIEIDERPRRRRMSKRVCPVSSESTFITAQPSAMVDDAEEKEARAKVIREMLQISQAPAQAAKRVEEAPDELTEAEVAFGDNVDRNDGEDAEESPKSPKTDEEQNNDEERKGRRRKRRTSVAQIDGNPEAPMELPHILAGGILSQLRKTESKSKSKSKSRTRSPRVASSPRVEEEEPRSPRNDKEKPPHGRSLPRIGASERQESEAPPTQERKVQSPREPGNPEDEATPPPEKEDESLRESENVDGEAMPSHEKKVQNRRESGSRGDEAAPPHEKKVPNPRESGNRGGEAMPPREKKVQGLREPGNRDGETMPPREKKVQGQRESGNRDGEAAQPRERKVQSPRESKRPKAPPVTENSEQRRPSDAQQLQNGGEDLPEIQNGDEDLNNVGRVPAGDSAETESQRETREEPECIHASEKHNSCGIESEKVIAETTRSDLPEVETQAAVAKQASVTRTQSGSAEERKVSKSTSPDAGTHASASEASESTRGLGKHPTVKSSHLSIPPESPQRKLSPPVAPTEGRMLPRVVPGRAPATPSPVLSLFKLLQSPTSLISRNLSPRVRQHHIELPPPEIRLDLDAVIAQFKNGGSHWRRLILRLRRDGFITDTGTIAETAVGLFQTAPGSAIAGELGISSAAIVFPRDTSAAKLCAESVDAAAEREGSERSSQPELRLFNPNSFQTLLVPMTPTQMRRRRYMKMSRREYFGEDKLYQKSNMDVLVKKHTPVPPIIGKIGSEEKLTKPIVVQQINRRQKYRPARTVD